MRIVIAGGPRCGKTRFAERIVAASKLKPDQVFPTDDLIGETSWSGASDTVSAWLEMPAPWLIEGVAVPRALRKWLASHPEGKPCDVLYWLDRPFVPQTKGQAAMHKGCVKVWTEIRPELVRRGVWIRSMGE